jgi:DNA-binding transcriptional ArsR family regulator
VQVAQGLSEQQHEANWLIFEAFGAALLLPIDAPDFASYLDRLEATPAAQFLAAVLQPLQARSSAPLASVSAYQASVQATYHNDPIDPILCEQAYPFLLEPVALKQLIVGHLGALWQGALAAEWRKRQVLVQSIVSALEQRVLPAASAPVIIRAVIGRDLPAELVAQISDVREIIFVPSPHVSLYASHFGGEQRLWVFVSVSIITAWALRQAPIRPTEVIARVEPLADQTNLRILDLLAQHGELSTTDLITQLGLSQPSISRHLKALGSYVIERRGEGASKRYRLSSSHIDWTLVTLQRFLESQHLLLDSPDLHVSGQPLGPQRVVAAASSEVPTDLRRFMDSQQRLTAFPTKRKDQLAVLAYMAEQLSFDRIYSEREINTIIRAKLHPSFDDFATIRRELYSWKFLDRAADGSRYWRTEPVLPGTNEPTTSQ